MEIRLEEEFQELLRLLNSHEVKYLVIGGYAVILSGHVRNTSDLDLAVLPDSKNADRLVAALEDFGFGGPSLHQSLFTRPRSLVRMGFEPLKIEILNYLEGVDVEKAFRDRRIAKLGKLEISLISLEDLIANKRAVARHQDLADVEKLIEINQSNTK